MSLIEKLDEINSLLDEEQTAKEYRTLKKTVRDFMNDETYDKWKELDSETKKSVKEKLQDAINEKLKPLISGQMKTLLDAQKAGVELNKDETALNESLNHTEIMNLFPSLTKYEAALGGGYKIEYAKWVAEHLPNLLKDISAVIISKATAKETGEAEDKKDAIDASRQLNYAMAGAAEPIIEPEVIKKAEAEAAESEEEQDSGTIDSEDKLDKFLQELEELLVRIDKSRKQVGGVGSDGAYNDPRYENRKKLFDAHVRGVELIANTILDHDKDALKSRENRLEIYKDIISKAKVEMETYTEEQSVMYMKTLLEVMTEIGDRFGDIDELNDMMGNVADTDEVEDEEDVVDTDEVEDEPKSAKDYEDALRTDQKEMYDLVTRMLKHEAFKALTGIQGLGTFKDFEGNRISPMKAANTFHKDTVKALVSHDANPLEEYKKAEEFARELFTRFIKRNEESNMLQALESKAEKYEKVIDSKKSTPDEKDRAKLAKKSVDLQKRKVEKVLEYIPALEKITGIDSKQLALSYKPDEPSDEVEDTTSDIPADEPETVQEVKLIKDTLDELSEKDAGKLLLDKGLISGPAYKAFEQLNDEYKKDVITRAIKKIGGYSSESLNEKADKATAKELGIGDDVDIKAVIRSINGYISKVAKKLLAKQEEEAAQPEEVEATTGDSEEVETTTDDSEEVETTTDDSEEVETTTDDSEEPEGEDGPQLVGEDILDFSAEYRDERFNKKEQHVRLQKNGDLLDFERFKDGKWEIMRNATREQVSNYLQKNNFDMGRYNEWILKSMQRQDVKDKTFTQDMSKERFDKLVDQASKIARGTESLEKKVATAKKEYADGKHSEAFKRIRTVLDKAV